MLTDNDAPRHVLLVGLGNPGDKYQKTRHNIGFEIIEALCSKHKFNLHKEAKFESLIASHLVDLVYSTEKKKTTTESKLQFKLTCALPQTFMNNSGRAVTKIMQFYKIKPEDLIVVHDDVSLDTGKLRLAFDRGAGGQHGVEDIMQRLGGSKAFHRLKVGVGPDPGGDERADYVLAKFPGEQAEIVNKILEDSWQHLFSLLTNEPLAQLRSVKMNLSN